MKAVLPRGLRSLQWRIQFDLDIRSQIVDISKVNFSEATTLRMLYFVDGQTFFGRNGRKMELRFSNLVDEIYIGIT